MYIVGTARWNNYPTIDITRRGGRKKERERRVRKDEEEICRQTFFEIALDHPAPLFRVITPRYYINENESRTSSNYPREGGKDLSRSTTQMHGISVINHDVTRAPEPEDKKVRK